jgi:uncharacterized protein YxeA
MKKVIFFIVFLIFGYYIISLYIDLKIRASQEIAYLKKKNKALQNEVYFSISREAILYLNNPKKAQSLKIATAGVYFCTISTKNKNIFPKLNYKSSICNNWSEQTKTMYKKYFSEANMTMDMKCITNGLDIVNTICLTH